MILFRGFVHALKLSPNLRKQSLEVRKAIIAGEMNKIWNLEVKKLDIILAMVRDPEEAEADPGQEEEKT